MKKLLSITILMLIVSVSFAQLGGSKGYTKVQSDAKYATITQLDGKVNLSDSIDATTVFYTKELTDSLIGTLGDNEVMKQMQMIGIPIVGIPILSYQMLFSSAALASTRAYYTIINIKKDTIVTGYGYIMAVSGAYTASAYNGIQLYSVNTSSGALTAISGTKTVDDGDIWKATANTLATKLLTTPITLTAGVYAIGFIYNSSAQPTAPTLSSFGSITNASGLFTVMKPATYRNTQSDLPATETFSTLSNNQTLYGIWLY